MSKQELTWNAATRVLPFHKDRSRPGDFRMLSAESDVIHGLSEDNMFATLMKREQKSHDRYSTIV